MRSTCGNQKTVVFSSVNMGSDVAGVVHDRCEMCGIDGPILECEMSQSGVRYQIYVCTGCAATLIDEVATVSAPAGENPS